MSQKTLVWRDMRGPGRDPQTHLGAYFTHLYIIYPPKEEGDFDVTPFPR